MFTFFLCNFIYFVFLFFLFILLIFFVLFGFFLIFTIVYRIGKMQIKLTSLLLLSNKETDTVSTLKDNPPRGMSFLFLPDPMLLSSSSSVLKASFTPIFFFSFFFWSTLAGDVQLTLESQGENERHK